MSDDLEHYWGDVLQSFQNGVQTDLRLKLAIEFLKSGHIPEQIITAVEVLPGETQNIDVTLSAGGRAGYALDLATELVRQAGERGLLKPMPEDDGLNKPTRQHIRRNIRAQVIQQIYAQEIQREEAPSIMGPMPPPVSIVPKR